MNNDYIKTKILGNTVFYTMYDNWGNKLIKEENLKEVEKYIESCIKNGCTAGGLVGLYNNDHYAGYWRILNKKNNNLGIKVCTGDITEPETPEIDFSELTKDLPKKVYKGTVKGDSLLITGLEPDKHYSFKIPSDKPDEFTFEECED